MHINIIRCLNYLKKFTGMNFDTSFDIIDKMAEYPGNLFS